MRGLVGVYLGVIQAVGHKVGVGTCFYLKFYNLGPAWPLLGEKLGSRDRNLSM